MSNKIISGAIVCLMGLYTTTTIIIIVRCHCRRRRHHRFCLRTYNFTFLFVCCCCSLFVCCLLFDNSLNFDIVHSVFVRISFLDFYESYNNMNGAMYWLMYVYCVWVFVLYVCALNIKMEKSFFIICGSKNWLFSANVSQEHRLKYMSIMLPFFCYSMNCICCMLAHTNTRIRTQTQKVRRVRQRKVMGYL